MATSGFMKPKVCEVEQSRKEQEPASLKGLCCAGGAGTEVPVVAFH